jgi:glycosyltransferase involved in cell wall biosynthesis
LPFVHDATLAAGNRRDFIREAGFERGGDGITAAWAALRSSEPLCLEDYPMLARVVSSSLGVIVHNHYLRGRIEALACPKVPIAVIPMLNMMRPEAATPSRREAKEALGLDPDGMLVGTFGFIASSKRLDQALEAFSRLRDRFPGIRFVCVGELAPEYDFAAVVTRLGLRDCVHVTGYTPMEMFRRYLYAVDAGLNLRHPTWGESSASLVRMMACGIPTLVSDVGAFAELADETVVKVPVGSGEVDAIASALRALLSDADLRTRIGAAARAYVEGQCAPKKVAEQYAAFIYRVIRTGSSIANR